MGLGLLVSFGFGHDDGGCRKSANGCSIDRGSKLEGLKMRSQGLVPIVVVSAPELNVGVVLLL